MIGRSVIMDLVPPDLTPYRRGNTGIDYVTTLDSGFSGPEVVINGLMHGNEICGAVAIDTFFRQDIRPRRGRLTLALANVAAYQTFDAARPFASRYVNEDMNRLWSPEVLQAGRRSVELARARLLWPAFERADFILDLHSMSSPGDPLILCGASAHGRVMAHRLGMPQWVVADAGHPGGRRLIDHPLFTTQGAAKTALLAECGQHWRAEAAAVAIEAAIRFLRALDVIDSDTAIPYLSTLAGQSRTVVVTDAVVALTDRFEFAQSFGAVTVLPAAGTLIAVDGGRPLRCPYDDCVLVLPTPRAIRGHVAVRLGRLVGD